MYTILVPIDDDEDRAHAQTEFVLDLPTEQDAVSVVLTHVLQGVERKAPKAMQEPSRVATVRDARDTLEEAGYEVEIAEAAAPPAEGILDLADEVDADLIVMGGRKRSPAGKVLFGSVTQAVVLDSSVPVVVTGSGGRE